MPKPLMMKKLKLNSSMKTHRPSRTNAKKGCPFHHRGLEYKSRKSKDTRNNRHVWPWSTDEAEQSLTVLSKEHTDHIKHPFPTTQETTLYMHITRCSILKSG